MNQQYSNKNILITGASSGIGEGFAAQFHALGANVVLVARRGDKLEAIASAMNQSRPNSATVLTLDLTDFLSEENGIKKLCTYISNNHIDILVNNAGVGSFGYFESIDEQYELNIINLNIIAPTKILQAVIPQMKNRKSGAVISLSSVAGIQPLPYMATYAASKAFNLFHSLALRQELSQFGVKVLTVCPGPTQTEFFGVARVAGQMTNVGRDSVEDVVRESIDALNKNKAVVVTGWKAKLMALGSNIMPKSISTWLVKKALEGSLQK